jgi:hypothetical protein
MGHHLARGKKIQKEELESLVNEDIQEKNGRFHKWRYPKMDCL